MTAVSTTSPSSDRRPTRRLPAITTDNEAFWTSGRDGLLRIVCCADCGKYTHPPSPRCSYCFGANVEPTAVSGRAVVETFTINVEPWEVDDDGEPYVIAIVGLAEQPSVRLTTNIVDCGPADVYIGMPVTVTFEHYDELFLPLFRPAANDTEASP
jgi:uncharacterized OB-fold protein